MSAAPLARVLLEFDLLPEEASSVARRVDALFFFLVAVSAFFVALIFVLIFIFAIKYRQRAAQERTAGPASAGSHSGNLKLEITWIVIPLILVMIMFGWGAKLYVHQHSAPADALDVFVVAKQWMWKFQYPDGRREIDLLHVPVGRPVRLKMISEDVIHSLFVPAFRIKQDVLPGYYTTVWFEATKPGEYHLFCSQYCGTEHSSMIGHVIAMDPDEYQRWLSGAQAGRSMVDQGRDLFKGRADCVSCHNPSSGARGPDLAGLPGSTVRLQDGKTVTADENYLRESILRPGSKIVYGYALRGSALGGGGPPAHRLHQEPGRQPGAGAGSAGHATVKPAGRHPTQGHDEIAR
jgi:cytochrome c oxidase subunit 2